MQVFGVDMEDSQSDGAEIGAPQPDLSQEVAKAIVDDLDPEVGGVEDMYNSCLRT